MRLQPGSRLGNYEVISGIGAGGMGEVYRAHDSVLERDVALKLVHPDFCHHPDSLSRLRREARLLAALNHPNVATLHGLAEFGDSCGLVMELVSGETLAHVLRRRRLKVDEALRFASQIAGGLEAAHDRGIIHRDLKPANIKITEEGNIKVLDFGLAKAEDEALVHDASTMVTAKGAVLGTAPYMSPEQTRGAELDRRTDIWAFGCVLYEMLTGRLAFDGGSRSDIVAAILEKEPDWSLLPGDTPVTVERLLRRCLRKDLRRRVRDIGDARLELEDATASDRPSDAPSAGAAAAGVVGNSRGFWLRAAALTGLGAVGGAAAATALRPTNVVAPGEVRFSITLPDDERLASTELGGLALSPDGRAFVYVATRGNTTQLVLRTLDNAATRVLQGTLGAVSPFYSPDGEWIAFFAEGKLKKMAARGGPPVTICDAADGLGGSWSKDGIIVFASATGAALQRVSADGGAVTRATVLDVSRGEFSHRWPEVLPDGDTVLFTVGTVGEWDEAEIAAQSLASGRRTPILKGGTNPRYLSSGHLAYAHDGAVWISAFDPRTLSLSGTPTRALEGVATSVDGAAEFAVAQSGATVFHPAAPTSTRRLMIVDGTSQTPIAAPPHAYVTPRLSPDGRKVLLGVADNAEHVWSYDLTAGTLTQLTFEATNRAPIWSADGRNITFASNRNGALNLFTAPLNGDGPTERLTTSDALQLPGSWSPDGQLLAFMEQHPTSGRDIWLLRRSGERIVFANGPSDESAPRFSPDGRSIAFVSNEAGQADVYVRGLNSSGAGRRLSASGGTEPVWRPDGKAIYFRSGGRLLEVALDGNTPRVVFDGAIEPGGADAAGYDVVGAGARFLMITSGSTSAPAELRVILNWRPASPS